MRRVDDNFTFRLSNYVVCSGLVLLVQFYQKIHVIKTVANANGEAVIYTAPNGIIYSVYGCLCSVELLIVFVAEGSCVVLLILFVQQCWLNNFILFI